MLQQLNYPNWDRTRDINDDVVGAYDDDDYFIHNKNNNNTEIAAKDGWSICSITTAIYSCTTNNLIYRTQFEEYIYTHKS